MNHAITSRSGRDIYRPGTCSTRVPNVDGGSEFIAVLQESIAQAGRGVRALSKAVARVLRSWCTVFEPFRLFVREIWQRSNSSKRVRQGHSQVSLPESKLCDVRVVDLSDRPSQLSSNPAIEDGFVRRSLGPRNGLSQNDDLLSKILNGYYSGEEKARGDIGAVLFRFGPFKRIARTKPIGNYRHSHGRCTEENVDNDAGRRDPIGGRSWPDSALSGSQDGSSYKSNSEHRDQPNAFLPHDVAWKCHA